MKLTVDKALQKGVEAHRAGNLLEADRHYTAILENYPKHPDANHNMGVLAVGLGKVKEALPFFKVALDFNETVAQFWLSYIDALIKLNKFSTAKGILDKAKNAGFGGKEFDRLNEVLIRENIEHRSSIENLNLPENLLQSLIALYNQGQFQKVLNKAAELKKRFPSSPLLYNLEGASNGSLKQFDESIKSYKMALKIKPDFAEAYNNLGLVLKDIGNIEAAIQNYIKAIETKPNFAEAYNNIAKAYTDIGNIETAIQNYIKAIEIKPDLADAYYNIAKVLEGNTFNQPHPNLPTIIEWILERKNYVRPRMIAPAAISLLKFNQNIKEIFKKLQRNRIMMVYESMFF